jgi:FkbM family methyltransferase
MSYSQGDEEAWILEAVGDTRDGIVLDIGAYDGKTFSNSLALIEAGWQAVLVEPSLTGFRKLVELHGNNPKVTLVHAVIGTNSGIIPFWDSDDAVSTTELHNFRKWDGAANFRPMYWCPQITMESLLDSFPELKKMNVLSIDTEGSSASLFAMFPFRIYNPKVICVEYDEYKNVVIARGELFGYRMTHENAENVILVKQ